MPDLPEPVQALTEPQQRAWTALAEGGRWRDAAQAAGAPVSTVWRWARFPIFRSMLDQRFMPLYDPAIDVMGKALDRALDDEADGRAIDTGLKAAQMVQRGLGIGGDSAGATRAGSPPSTVVAVHVEIAGIFRAELDPITTINVIPVDAAPLPVAESQPLRSRTSSQRTKAER